MSDSILLPTIYQLLLDDKNVVLGSGASNVLQDGYIEVGKDIYNAVLGRYGCCRYIDGLVQDYASVSAPMPASVTGNQLAFALADLGLASLWQVAVVKSKDKDQIRIGLIARDTRILSNDPLLIRVAGNAGLDADGKPAIDWNAVFASALTQST